MSKAVDDAVDYTFHNNWLKLCIGALGQLEGMVPAAKSMLEVAEAVTKKIDEQPRGRRAAIKAQKERKKNAQT